MKRIEVWVEFEDGQEEDVRSKVDSALSSLHLKHTILPNSTELGRTEERQK